MSSLQSRITALVPVMDGWCSIEKANDLALAVIKSHASVSVEIGVWGGRSLIPMALAHQEQNQGIVWAIDPWSSLASVEGYDAANSDWWGKQDHEMIYQRFLASARAHGVEKFIKIVRQKSDAIEPPPVIDVLHVDGQHTEQAVRDVERFASRVRVGGFCFVDDIGWSGGGPAAAVEKLLTMGFVKLFDRDTGAMFERQAAKVAKPAEPRKTKKVAKKIGRPAGSQSKPKAVAELVAS